NLGLESQPPSTRKAELIIDAEATDAQAAALTGLLREKFGGSLGQILAVRRGAIRFEHSDGPYVVKTDGFAEMRVRPMPNGECCKQPHLVWYSPLIPLDNRKVGYTEKAAYSSDKACDAWRRAGENSAFYGSFTLN